MKKKPTPRPGELVHAQQDRNDGWKNLVTLLGTSADKRTHNRINWEFREPAFYEELYAGGGIPARIVDVVPEHALRNWVDWLNLEGETKMERQYAREAIEERCLELDLRGKFLNSWKWGRAYGGACLHIVTDTSDPASPIQVGEKVLALRDLSRWDLRILTTDIEYDFGSPNYGHPRIYYLNVQMGSQYKGYPIHWTRMIRFDGQLVPRRTYIRNNYWHDSILNRIYNSIRNYEGSNDAVAAMLHDFNTDVYKLKNLANLIGAGKEQIVRNRIEMMNYVKSVINAMIIDANDEDWENKQRSVEGVAELLRLQANRLVADTDIPHTILLGESPDGSNATGNSTSQAWYNFLKSEQEHVAKPKLNRLVDIIFPDQEELRPKFRAIRILDDVEAADMRLKVAQTDQIYLEEGVLDASEVTESRFGGDEYSIDTELDEEGRASGSIVPHAEGEEDEPESFESTGDQPPEGSKEEEEQGPSEPETRGNKQKPGSKSADMTGRKKEVNDAAEPAEEAFENAKGESQYEPRNEVGTIKNGKPRIKSFISQTMSEPFRDPDTDPKIKGPGVPNKQRTFLPTRGTGVVAQSGADWEKDRSFGGQREGGGSVQGVEPVEGPASKAKKVAYDTDEAPKKAASIIVRRGDAFLMGRRKDGTWALPGGHIEKGESHHQGALRELSEETGMQASKLKFLGGRMVEPKQGQSVHVNLYEHQDLDMVKPSAKADPDKEFKSFKWFSTKEPLPEDVLGSLAHPNNVGLLHLGLLK